MTDLPIPEGVAREFLLAVAEMLGLDPAQVKPEIGLRFAGNKVLIDLTAVVPAEQVFGRLNDLLREAKAS